MKTVRFPSQDIAARQAAAWIATLDRGISASEEQRLHHWLEESPAHGEMLVQCAYVWDMADALKPIASILPIEQYQGIDRGSVAQSDGPMSHTVFSGIHSGYLIAASLGLLTIAVLILSSMWGGRWSGLDAGTTVALKPIPDVQTADHRTAVGERSTVLLPDGSELVLNTDTRVSIAFSDTQRRLILKQGEVYFDVAKDSARPFVVATSVGQVTAVGTAFNIDSSGREGTEVLVTEGRVRIDRNGSSDDQPDVEIDRDNTVYLSPGEKVVLSPEKTNVLQEDDMVSALAWKEGMIIFSGEPLETVVHEIDRYTPLELRIVDPGIASIPVGGFFKTGDMDQLLRVLEQNFGVRSERRGKQILLSKAS